MPAGCTYSLVFSFILPRLVPFYVFLHILLVICFVDRLAHPMSGVCGSVETTSPPPSLPSGRCGTMDPKAASDGKPKRGQCRQETKVKTKFIGKQDRVTESIDQKNLHELTESSSACWKYLEFHCLGHTFGRCNIGIWQAAEMLLRTHPGDACPILPLGIGSFKCSAKHLVTHIMEAASNKCIAYLLQGHYY